ncbi:serine hydrolase domain-containing protein [Pedobacter caeni]|uniref:CubicO group peptidase, beta-lactamase class C family n=1 Tax=Pedobacter caeni TaxID=288992 RepID=A0A1M4UGY4_9SPHI|nr:serine hydrolase domain-containing protein [Pedobacter caeni]SHE55914.1 CubicO group peptidase, beta-lactamase class C family [Pedobacter caeni]
MRLAPIYLILPVFLLGCSSSHHEFEGKKSEKAVILELEKIIAEKLPKNRSISGAIVKGDKIIWSKAFGISNLKTQSLADTASIYRIGSISKPFTAFLMMLLVQDRVINLDDPVELYFPEIKKLNGYSEATKITFQQLATHTSGLMREPELPNAASGSIEEWESKILEAIPTTSFESKPGEKFSYSNIGYGILGLALSKAAQKPFIELIEKRIFEPLNMNSSYFAVPKEKLSDLSTGIQDSDGKMDVKTPLLEHSGRGYKVPNGGIYSTPNDLAKFMIYNMGTSSNLVSGENLEMMQNEITGIGERNYYGIGFFVNRRDQLTIINHGGAVAGYTANFAFARANKYGIILMRNYSQGEPDIWELPFELLEALNKVKQ